MASFGSFETEREVYSDLIYSVYNARKRDDPAGDYAVKVFRLPDPGLEAEVAPGAGGREEMVRARLNSIEIQEQAASTSKCVAPVLERGNDARGIWYATRFYPRSINKMMSGKVALPRASLEHLLASIAQGALDLKRACGRSHGDIRPTNVQVGKGERLTDAEVMLCDPRPGAIDKAQEFELADLRAIGLILLQLVRQRIFSNEDAALLLPIGPSEEWSRTFGSDASDWLAICNRLLDPHLSLDRFSLEKLVERLTELRPKRQGPPKFALIGLAAAVLLLLLGLWLLRSPRQTLLVTSDPSGARVVVDGVGQEGVTPLRITLKNGPHVLEARLDQPGMTPQATNYLAKKGAAADLHFSFTAEHAAPSATITKLDSPSKPISESPPKRIPAPAVTPAPPSGPGMVELLSDSLPASVFDAEGRELGRVSPDTPLKLTQPAGTYLFTARVNGLDDVTVNAKVEPAATSQYRFVFDYATVEWLSGGMPVAITRGGQTSTNPATFLQKPEVATQYVLVAAGYDSATNVLTLSRGEHKRLTPQLRPKTIALALTSDPPGAEFYTENGIQLGPTETNHAQYYVASSLVALVARFPGLDAITNGIQSKLNHTGSELRFNFNYGMLILSNLSSDVVVYEGTSKIGVAADKFVFQKPGPHVYALRTQTETLTVQTNIDVGVNCWLTSPKAELSWKNSLGIWFAWIPNLPGGGAWPGQKTHGGWVGISEITQAQYKKMDGSNPSAYQEGGENYPVENVGFDQAAGFCRWLTSADTAPRLGWQYTLPTEEQFAAFVADADRISRVSSEGRMPSSTDDALPLQRGFKIATAPAVNSARTHPEPVGSTRQSNQYGLYDVVGNVWEWLNRPGNKDHVAAGGSYLNFSQKTLGPKARERSSDRGPNIGFRLVLVPPR